MIEPHDGSEAGGDDDDGRAHERDALLYEEVSTWFRDDNDESSSERVEDISLAACASSNAASAASLQLKRGCALTAIAAGPKSVRAGTAVAHSRSEVGVDGTAGYSYIAQWVSRVQVRSPNIPSAYGCGGCDKAGCPMVCEREGFLQP